MSKHRRSNPQQSGRASSTPDASEVTRILKAVSVGEAGAQERLIAMLYDALHELAQRQLAKEHGPRTLSPTGLLNEAYLKVFGKHSTPAGPVEPGPAASDATADFTAGVAPEPDERAAPPSLPPPVFENRQHLIGSFSRAMSQVLIDAARRRRVRGRRFSLDEDGQSPALEHERPAPELTVAYPIRNLDAWSLVERLSDLEAASPRAAEVVRMRCFLGLATGVIAETLGVSARSVERDWVYAKAFLRRAVESEAETGGGL
ncbi:MAG: ECF-type sigma factor [Planctomycetota bacterium]